MSSVTGRIKQIKQPRGGYIKPSQFAITKLEDGKELNEKENIHATIIGMTVDYLTRFMQGAKLDEAFKISLQGAKNKAQLNRNTKAIEEIRDYLKGIKGLDDESIINACKCTTFDVWYRNIEGALYSKTAQEINPDKDTIENIKIMVERSLTFSKTYGPITVDGFTFETDGYTETVDHGDGDFLTADTLWEFKVIRKKPDAVHTLQLLMYWIMGQHSRKPEFKGITKLGIFNPRLNIVYSLPISDVSPDVIAEVENDVICY